MPKALLVEDDRVSLRTLGEWVERQGCSATLAPTLRRARAELRRQSFDLILLDLQMPDGDGLELLDEIESQPDAVVAIVTGNATVDSALAAFRGGAVDFLTKPVDLARLRSIVAHATRAAALRAELEGLRADLREAGRFEGLIGASERMQEIYDRVLRVAPTDATVFIHGETGTGKELVAEAIHARSRRAAGPFIAVNCGAVSPSLIESELFGHERGSFTGAQRTHQGFFERASGGTLFLDELTEMPVELQVKLLRVLETEKLQRVGGYEQVRVDVRVVAATNRDPEEAAAAGKLREDLLYRLLVFPIRLPPLRERPDDVELLASHFLDALNAEAKTSKRFSPACLEQLREHSWPGNVRELKNVVESAFILASDRIQEVGLPAARARPARTSARDHISVEVGSSMADANRRLILATLAHCQGDKQKTAKILGISLKTLYNRLNAFESEASRG
jgi:DNA-binding NtrC family response regulator